MSKSGEWDSNPRIFALQANAVAAVPPPHYKVLRIPYLKLFLYCFKNALDRIRTCDLLLSSYPQRRGMGDVPSHLEGNRSIQAELQGPYSKIKR